MPETTHTHLEDALDAGAPVADPEKVLDDEQLRDGGLAPVRAWVRTKASKNALRAKRSREKAEKGEGGAARKQVSLLAPPDEQSRAVLREIGKRMVAGEISADDLHALGKSPKTEDDEEALIGRRALGLIKSGGFRGRILRHLLGYQRA